MRKLAITTITAALVVTTLGPATAVKPAAEGERAKPVRLAKARYDSPGSDTGSNASLNAEWIAIKNTGNRPRQLRGWTLRDRAGHVFHFPRFKLRPGRTVKVHTGRGRDNRRHLYWDRDWYVWNNDGDRATLRNRNGRVIDRCSWGDGGGVKRC